MSVGKPFDPLAYVELMQAAMDIPLREEWKAGVTSHLANAARMAELLEAVEIDPNSLELAGVFEVRNFAEESA